MKTKMITIALLSGMLFSCGGGEDASKAFADQAAEHEDAVEEVYEDMEDSGIGIGPISSVELGEIDEKMVANGEEIFKANCTACHKISKMFVGPALAGITTRRSPEWIMNMILNPEEMTEKDPVAKELFAEYLSPMANQNLTEEEARNILEYLRTKN